MRNLIFKYSFFSLLASFLTLSCSDSELDKMNSNNKEDLAIVFGSALTKAPVTDIKTMSDFSVWGWATNEVNELAIFEATTVHPQTGKYEDGERYWLDGYTHDFFAVHPKSTASVSIKKNGEMSITDFKASATGTKAIDLMTASKTKIVYNTAIDPTSKPAPVSLNFTHELAKIKFTVKASEEATLTTQLYGVHHKGSLAKQIAASNLAWKTSWNLTSANTASDTPFTDKNMRVPKFDGTSAPLLFGGELLLPPQALQPNTEPTATTLKIIITYKDKKTIEKTINLYDIKKVTNWESSKAYNYEITIPKNTFDINITVSVTDWNNKDFSTTL